MKPLLSIENLTVAFGKSDPRTIAVDNLSFTVNSGEIVAVVGESGSGKSVTALSILRLLPEKITSFPGGKIWLHRKEKPAVNLLTLSENEIRAVRGAAVSMVFQEPMTSLNPVLTCGDQVLEAIRVHRKLPPAQAREQVIALFEKVRLPDPVSMLNRYPHEISGGQKQRVMIAMALCSEPDLLIADEPTTALDVTVQKSILELLANLQEQTKMGLIFITHDLGIVRDIAHRVIVLYRGKMVEENTAAGLFSAPRHPYTKALLACRPALYPKGTRLPVVSDFMPAVKSSSIAPSPAAATHEKPTRQTGFPLLDIKDLHVWFPLKKNFLGTPLTFTKAVNGISFQVQEGETLGVVGESGCGKSTLGRAMLRLIPVSSGQIFHNGKDLLSLKKHELSTLRKEVQIVFQDPYASLNPRLKIGDAIAEAMKVHGLGKDAAGRKDAVVELLEKVDLRADHYNRYPHAFSGGQRQRIGIARALALDPGFIIFDESVSALDVSIQAQVLNLINDLKQEYGFTALFISHDLGVIRYISDRILVMKSGKMEETGTTEAIFTSPQSAYTQTLLAAIPGSRQLRI